MSYMPSDKIRVLVVDDYPLVRQGLIDILKKQPDIAIVGEASGVGQALDSIRASRPDVILMDTTLEDSSLVTAIRLILSHYPDMKILALADQSERNCAVLRGTGRCKMAPVPDIRQGSDCVVQSIKAGAKGAIRLSDSSTELVTAIKTIAEGHYWVDGNATARVMESLFTTKSDSGSLLPGSLTSREDLICRLIADGLSNKEIASRLSIAQQTVKNHVSSILRKTGLEDRLQIARAILLKPQCVEENKKRREVSVN